MVFFSPQQDDSRPDPAALLNELAIFDRDRSPEANGASIATPAGPARQRANQPETRSAPTAMTERARKAAFASASASGNPERRNYRPMIFADEVPAESFEVAEPIGTWRLPRRHPHEQRILADSSNRRAWMQQRARGITATDAAKLATDDSIHQVVRDKLRGGTFGGNAYTEYGRHREPHIAAWVSERHQIDACGLLFHAEESHRHLATPDGLACSDDGQVTLAEIKTTKNPWSRIPRTYLRQVWWQQYVLGAERTLFVWERHRNFVVVDEEPRYVWIDRDEAEIKRLVKLADRSLEELDRLQAELDALS